MTTKALIAAICFLLPASSWAGEARTYTVAGSSMSPTLMEGDTVVVSDEGVDGLKRGDLAAIRFAGRTNPMVKRVAAIAGDMVEIKGDRLLVNGKEICFIDSYRWRSTIKQLERYRWILPENNVFILGDNPENSRDSRRLGLISTEQVKGKVIEIIRDDKQLAVAH